MKHTSYDLKQMQSLPLEAKISMTKRRIRDWYDYFGGNVYLSVSGKDSTVLRDMALSVHPDIECVYVDTGLEYPEVKKFIKSLSPQVTILRPQMLFVDVIKQYGYPIIGKEVSECVLNARQFLSRGGYKQFWRKLNGIGEYAHKGCKSDGQTNEEQSDSGEYP